ncbi:MAG: bifunctional glutamate N-acetyltransferase/amino-acid acetyltransferase ArgJ [Candidatus Omnitrophica bacterium]|nr:bifunctional glutamate N-acetyltransferase/amino-acid acetyltransferase ArgJ [Candidatus Omnitrophota bacterium]MBU1871556.1 bifunctional glutamate N-acetyltransferase/amino-acid acetyltransferase ArgJ [Candidatus Omnitrophota bacterium]
MKENIKKILPLGYKANGLSCGIKKSGKPDLCLIISQNPAQAIGLFTANKITSGSVKLAQANLKKSRQFRSIIANSGNANCFSINDSFLMAKQVVKELSSQLKIKASEILIASTGIIGKSLPVERIKKALPELIMGLSKSGLLKSAQAIMTTDTFVKASVALTNIAGKPVTVCGIAKGAGMIAPNLGLPKATMLCFILSDANIRRDALGAALLKAVELSFNSITVDGCMSTNDSIFLMSNSFAANPRISRGGVNFEKFSCALNYVCLDLAKMIVKDAEGSSKFIRIQVKQAKNYGEAKKVALSIANSDLFKTAIYGKSRNLGRIVAAVGASGVDVKERKLRITLSSLYKKDVFLEVGLSRGNAQATVYTSDLTTEYIKINAAYS